MGLCSRATSVWGFWYCKAPLRSSKVQFSPVGIFFICFCGSGKHVFSITLPNPELNEMYTEMLFCLLFLIVGNERIMHDKHYCLSCFFFIFRTQTASSNSKEGIFTVCRPSNTTLVSNYRSKQCLLKPDDSFSSCKCEFLKLTNQFLECKDHRKHWIGSWKMTQRSKAIM